MNGGGYEPLSQESTTELPVKQARFDFHLTERVGVDTQPLGELYTQDFVHQCRRYVRDQKTEPLPGGGQGRVLNLNWDKVQRQKMETLHKQQHEHVKLGTLPSTAICGNDITASCFYVVGELSKSAGVYAPLCTLLSSLTLYCFRSIYGEVVTALPLNGGIYNLLLNSSTKRSASVIACLTILSYTATGVVSATSAADYIHHTPAFHWVPVLPTAVTILGFFAVMNIMGMSESAVVATVLFLFHLATLFVVLLCASVHIWSHGCPVLWDNLHWPDQPPTRQAIFYGFSAAMLGVSGFETSANFVEEQRPHVFALTLTNMWLAVSCINTSLSAFAIAIIPLDDLVGAHNADSVAYLADVVGGPWLRNIVAIDALAVLAGSVLTSYVGVIGLFQRMAGDRCLPDFFIERNEWRQTPHYTIITFFVVCASMCVLLNGDITLLSSIYAIAFLLVMALFAACGLWLKIVRPTLPRVINSHWSNFALGAFLVMTAFTAVCVNHPEVLVYFYLYYAATVAIVLVTFSRTLVMKWMLTALQAGGDYVKWPKIERHIQDALAERQSQGVAFFTKSADLSQLNKAILYILGNEEAKWIRVVHCCDGDSKIVPNLMEFVQFLDCMYLKCRIDCVITSSGFDPVTIDMISQALNVPINCMFITCPTSKFRHRLDKLGGVRVILNTEPTEAARQKDKVFLKALSMANLGGDM
mmetsp:Transcript_71831/g.191592  ORF Transcript_71831/g.191592 Transcript_71831/m.191592 type:complete len:699 (+) Transcript_71831:33-2129(+)